MEFASSSRRQVKVAPTGLLFVLDQSTITIIMEKIISRVHQLLVDTQSSYLSQIERLKVLEQERNDKES